MKKLVSLVLVLCLALSMVVIANADDAVTVRLWRKTFNLAEPDEAQVKKVEDAINAYIADKINVKIELHDIVADYESKANLALAGDEIDLLWTASWETIIGTNDLVPAKAVKDITALLEGTALYNSMAAGQWEATKYDGKNYFIPVYKDNVEGYDIMYRQDLADQFGWDFSNVTKLADIEPMLADAASLGLKYPYLTQKTAMFYRWYIGDFDFFTGDSATNFFAVDRATNTVVDTILTPQYAEFAKLMGSWAEKGYLSEDDATKVTTDTTTQSKDWAISWWTDLPVNDEADARYGQDVSMKAIAPRFAHSNSALGSCYAIPAKVSDEVAKAAIDFMGLLYTDSKLADLYTFGIEGEDYEYDEKGQVKQHSDKYNHSMWESASATVVTPLYNEPANKADLYVDFNGGAETSCAAGFRFNKEAVEAEYTACANLFEQYGYALEHGVIAPDDVEAEIAAYQADLDAAGYQKVLAEFSAQYEAWKAQ